jgi:hypothetical protein
MLLAGCQVDQAPSGDPDAAEGDAQPVLVDTDGLVDRHRFLMPLPDREVLPHLDAPVDSRAVVIPGPQGIDARVVWLGSPCQTAPSVEVTRDQGRVAVAVDRGPTVGGDVCNDSEVSFAVDLAFAGDHGFDTVDARVSGRD